MKVVLDWIRSKGIACWCHMDDIILTGNNRTYLEHVTLQVVERLNHADWKISHEKSVLRPVSKIEYLGVYISINGIEQTPKMSSMKRSLLELLESPLLLSAKQKEIIAGTNNYYNLFIVHNSTLNINIMKNITLVSKNIAKVAWLYDKFTSKKKTMPNGEFVLVVADATDTQMAAIVNNTLIIIKLNKKVHSNTTEILAPLIALRLLNVDTRDRNICIKVDNNTAKAVYTRNRVRLQRKQLSFEIFCIVAEMNNAASSISCEYVKSADNPADFFSRVDFKSFIKQNICELVNASLNEILQTNIIENIYLRIAIFDNNLLQSKERNMAWKCIANYVDSLNEKRFNVNNKMFSKGAIKFEKLEPVDLLRT